VRSRCTCNARLAPRRNDRVELLLARGLTVLLGALGTTLALLLASATVFSVFDLFVEVLGLFVGVLAGLFVLGMFTVRAHALGALLGGLIGAVCLAGVKQFTDVHFYLYSAVGVVSCVVVGYLLSLVLPGRPRAEGLTIYTLPRRTADPAGQASAAGPIEAGR